MGLECCDKNSKILAHKISIAGMDVIYTRDFRTSVEIVQAAVQEDVDVLLINYLSCSNITSFTSIPNLLKKANALDIKLLAYDVIDRKVAKHLTKQGISEVFLQNTPFENIISRLQGIVSYPRSI
jgi:methylmalonyl-CoA mutase cobalamin-binding domain/chain